MAIAGMVIGGVVALAFVLDMVLGFPFGGRVMLMDVGFFVCGAILAYLSLERLARYEVDEPLAELSSADVRLGASMQHSHATTLCG